MRIWIMFLAIIVMMPLASAVGDYVYDDFQDNYVNWSLWSNTTTQSGTNTYTVSESSGYLRQTATATTSGSRTGFVNTTQFPTVDEIKKFVSSMYLSTYLSVSSNSATASATSRFYALGNLIQQLSQSGTGSSSSTRTYVFTYDALDDDVNYSVNGVFTGTIDPSHNQFAITSIASTSGGQGTGISEIRYLNYSLSNDIYINLTQPSDQNYTTYPMQNFSARTEVPDFIDSESYDLDTATIYIHNDAGGLAYSEEKTISGTIADVNWTVDFGTNPDTFIWYVKGCGTKNSGSFCEVSSNKTLYYGITKIAESYESNVYETEQQYYNLNVSLAGSSVSSATLVWNNTEYEATTSLISGKNYSLSRSLDIPVYGTTDKTFYWKVTLANGAVFLFTNTTQSITPATFTLCSPTYSTPYLNITFKNETVNKESVSAYVPSAVFDYYIGSGGVRKSYSFSNATANYAYTLCADPINRTFYTNTTFVFTNDYSQQRQYQSSMTLNNGSMTNKTLWLLPTTEGLFVTFQVLSVAEQPIQGVLINISREGYGVINSVYTGSSGTATIFLDPDFAYSISASKTGYNTFTATQTFSTSEFTITLGTASSVSQDYLTGVLYQIRPPSGTLLNQTAYNFNFTFASTYWPVERWGYYLVNGTGDVLAFNTSTDSSGGFLSSVVNTGENDYIEMQYYWVINGTYVNQSINWGVFSVEGGSIGGFFTRLDSYIDDGIFGITSIGRAILLFFIIFLITGVLSYKFGFNSPEGITVTAAAIVIFFDYGLNMIPQPFERALPHSISILAVLLVVVVFLRRNT